MDEATTRQPAQDVHVAATATRKPESFPYRLFWSGRTVGVAGALSWRGWP